MEALQIRIPSDVWDRDFAVLARDADVAARAAALVEVPSSADFRRYNDLAALIELRAMAYARRSRGAVEAVDVSMEEPEERHSWAASQDGSAQLVTVFARLQSADGQQVRRAVPEPLRSVARGRQEEKASELRLRRAEAGNPFVADNFAPDDLAEGLHRLARARAGRSPGEVRVLYIDTSEAAPFPVARLSMDDDGRPLTVLKMSLMSGRHQEMDADMHGAWFRNNELSGVTEANADTDALAYRLSKRHLGAIADIAHPVEIEIHLTGLEPAIVGFFRAVAEHLERLPGSLRVRPRYYRGVDEAGEDNYEDGGLWTNR